MLKKRTCPLAVYPLSLNFKSLRIIYSQIFDYETETGGIISFVAGAMALLCAARYYRNHLTPAKAEYMPGRYPACTLHSQQTFSVGQYLSCRALHCIREFCNRNHRSRKLHFRHQWCDNMQHTHKHNSRQWLQNKGYCKQANTCIYRQRF